MVPTGRIGVYVHVPFCLRRCPYCDFAVVVTREIPHDAYREAVLAELAHRHASLESRTTPTLYFGGGTPGLWRSDCVGAVVQAVRATPGVELEEVTIEVNPEDAHPHHLAALREVGVDRISLGAQSFDEETLTILGRHHSGRDIERAIEAAVASGFERISLDLIHGVPGESLSRLERDLDRVADNRALEHVSIYELTIEAGTAFAARERRGELSRVDDERLRDETDRIAQRLESAGFRRYEVSSYARPRGEAIHNAAYWYGDEYLGLGVGAHSLAIARDRAFRSANTAAIRRYIEDPTSQAESETLTPTEHLAELIMLGVRTVRGVDFGALAERFEVEEVEAHRALAERWVERGWGNIIAEVFRPTHEGLHVADTMAEQAIARSRCAR